MDKEESLKKFPNFIGNVRRCEYTAIRNEILALTQCRRQIFHRWEQGLNLPQRGSQIFINHVAKKYGYPIVYEEVESISIHET